MKQLILILLLLMAINLFSEMSYPTTFWSNPINLSEQNSIFKQEETTYLVFSDNTTSEVIFAKGDGEDFEFLVIDEYCLNNYPPTLCFADAETILLTYSRNHPGIGLETVVAKSIDNGDNFELSILDEDILVPVIDVNNNIIRVAGYSGTSQYSSNYSYFTDTEESENHYNSTEAGIIKFWGRDELHGPLHSNSDIWIQNAGGGSNSGFPTFWGPVTTSGRILTYPEGQPIESSGYPLDEIFRAGYTENLNNIELINNISELEENGTHLADEADVLYIELNGNSYAGYSGVIESRLEEFDVYSWYPSDESWINHAMDNEVNWFEDSHNIYTNQVTLYDTIWTEISGDIADDSAFFTEADLWIKGAVQGKQVWGSSGKVRILGDIYYSNTGLGGYPDGFSGYDESTQEPQYDGVVNNSDYFCLLSDQRINIGYKYRHPATEEIISVSDGENDNLYLYGIYAAAAVGDETVYGEYASHYDGIFSYEYQHPHGSTPDFLGVSPYTLDDTMYTYVDLHKYIFPGDPMVLPELLDFNLYRGLIDHHDIDNRSSGYPNYNPPYFSSAPNTGVSYHYPGCTDYPWYNPVWPEAINDAMFERGDLNIFGSLIQRRRGYIHRSGSDPNSHSYISEWDLDNYLYGSQHHSTGFNKDYMYDTRLQDVEFIGIPTMQTYFGDAKITVLESSDLGESFNLVSEYQLESITNNSFGELSIISDGDDIVFIQKKSDESIFWNSTDGGLSFSEHQLSGEELTPHINNGILYVKRPGVVKGFYLDDMLLAFNDDLTSIWYHDITTLEDNIASIHYFEDDRTLVYNFTIDNSIEFEGFYLQYYNHTFSSLGEIDIYGLNETEVILVRNRSVCKMSYGTLDGIVDYEPEEVISLKPTLKNYPNPFNPSTTISFNLPEDVEEASIEIFNIKGQKIKQYSELENQNSVVWNGTDENENPVSSGVYFGVLKSENKILSKRKLILLK